LGGNANLPPKILLSPNFALTHPYKYFRDQSVFTFAQNVETTAFVVSQRLEFLNNTFYFNFNKKFF